MTTTQKTTLVTGGAGFLGSHLVDRLLHHGHKVIAVDNLITGNTDNISHLAKTSQFEFIEHDITQKTLTFPDPVDYVYNMASPASPMDYLELPFETLKVGSYGTHHVLEFSLEKKARFLLASTSEVYGDPEIHPQPETYWGNVNSIGPRSVYDEAKRYAEAVTMAYQRHKGLETRIVRIFNTYGPRMRPNDGRVVPAFCVQALKGLPLSVFGDGSQTRSFCYVSDLICGIHLLMESECSLPVNIGNPTEMTVHEFAKKIISLSNSTSTIEYKPLPEDDPKIRRPVIDRAQEKLGWSPEKNLEEGLLLTLDYFRSLVDTKKV